MNAPEEQFDDSVEVRLTRFTPHVVAEDLREATLDRVRRELRSSRWDRRLGRLAVVLLVVGFALNVATARRPQRLLIGGEHVARPSAETIAEAAVSMGEATDFETAAAVGRHLAALNGFPPASHETEAVVQEIDRLLSPAMAN